MATVYMSFTVFIPHIFTKSMKLIFTYFKNLYMKLFRLLQGNTQKKPSK